MSYRVAITAAIGRLACYESTYSDRSLNPTARLPVGEVDHLPSPGTASDR